MKTLITLITALTALTSCSKIEDIAPQLPDTPTEHAIHIMTDSAIVNLMINGEYRSVGSMNDVQLNIIKVDSIEYWEAARVAGKKSTLTVYKGRYRNEYGNFLYLKGR